MSTSETAAEHGDLPVIHLSQLLRSPVLARSGEAVGRVEDVIVRLRGADDYPLVNGIVAGVGGRRVFIGSKSIHEYAPNQVVLAKNKVDLRGFERRGENGSLRSGLVQLGEQQIIRAEHCIVLITPHEVGALHGSWQHQMGLCIRNMFETRRDFFSGVHFGRTVARGVY